MADPIPTQRPTAARAVCEPGAEARLQEACARLRPASPAEAAADLLPLLIECAGALRGSVLLLNPATGRLVIAAAQGLPEGLLGRYEAQGLEVIHIAIDDPTSSPDGYSQLDACRDRICDAFDALPKPVLVHCSAGIARTGFAVDYIRDMLEA